MTSKILLAAGLLLAILGIWWMAPAVGEEMAAADAAYETMTVTVPKGNAKAGRLAFAVLHCWACHRVTGDEALPEPVAAVPGPELGPAVARRKPGELATSILAPSHSISEEVRQRIDGDKVSPMGDYSESMRVRQLVNLVAFLRSLDDTESAESSAKHGGD